MPRRSRNGPIGRRTIQEFIKAFAARRAQGFADGKIEDTGALTTASAWKRSTTRPPRRDRLHGPAGAANKPFFTWMNTTRMHVFTHVRPSPCGQERHARQRICRRHVEHDGDVGKLLKKLDDLGIADNTIVVYTTDNGPNQFTWPDAATTPFRSEKDTNWEGAFRVPAMVRWPGHIKPGQVSNGMWPASTGSRRCSRPPATPMSRIACSRAGSRRAPPFKVPSRRLQPARLPHRQDRTRARATTSTTSTTTAARRDALRRLEGRLQGTAAAGRFRSLADSVHDMALPKLFNLRMDPMNAQTSYPTSTTTGWSATTICSSRAS
jgi:hypothetical protein